MSGSESGFGFLPSPVKKRFTSKIVDVGEIIDPEDIPPAVLVQQEKLETMKEQKKIKNPCKFSRTGRPNPFPRYESSEGGWLLREEMLQRVPWDQLLATGPEDTLHNRHKFFCIICCVTLPVQATGVYEIKRHYQNVNHLRQEQRYIEKYFPEAIRGKGAQKLYGTRLAAEHKMRMDWEVPEKSHKWHFLRCVRVQAVCVHQC